ncbi:MAG: endolytic transglycosylase MltG [SAR86 cluster bacterium]|uniref:Endolytic murein transglycosylase n=1 Tax=SAR86 cluster bacterium TaxID=2030880 RepID=A0A838Y2A4_9GAMM|nr:endolytic transglycosylase MltG [SAR86 cluster bacterium]
MLGTSESYSQLRVDDRLEFYNVSKGDSFNSIFNDFDLHPIQKIFFKIYLKKNKLQVAQAGHYYLKNKSWKEFLNSVSNGDVVIFKLEIPSGKNLYEVKKIISESNFKNDCDNFDCLDNKFNFVEGTLNPDTYFYKHSSSLASILQKSQTEFFQLATNLWINKNPQLPIKNLSDAIILASIVEKEAGNDDEKPIIAGVFLHRISIGMKLQADPTIIYGLLPNFNGDITKANLRDKNNLYNTYQISGLPPTPISTVSKSSLEAVILGMKNDYLYFVAKGDGTHKFSKTYQEHLDAVKRYQLN